MSLFIGTDVTDYVTVCDIGALGGLVLVDEKKVLVLLMSPMP